MIRDSDIVEIGQFNRPHGIKGEINATVDPDVDLDKIACVITDIDGINTPFFIKSWRPKSATTVLLTIDGIETDEMASSLNNKKICINAEIAEQFTDEELDDGQFYLEDLVGFTISDDDPRSFTGTIESINDATSNILFEVKTDKGNVLLIPAVDEYISDIDIDRRHVIVTLPEGFLEM